MADKMNPKEAEKEAVKESETSQNTPKPETEKKKKDTPIPDGNMKIKVYSPYQTYFDDEASSISAANDTGPFDILPQHHKFLTLLVPCELDIVTSKGNEKIKISRGIMYVKEDRVTVFLDV